MRVIVIGMGVQGAKRARVAGSDLVATVDPNVDGADYRDFSDISPAQYDAALVCTPDAAKPPLLKSLLRAGKHVLVEKPLLGNSAIALSELADIASVSGVACYTAYNHRFEPHFAGMKALLDSGRLGKIYRCRMFYGNGTAENVRQSPWRDSGAGVLPDLGSHLLDSALYWFGDAGGNFRVISADRHENKAFDHVVVGRDGDPAIEMEMTLLSWRNGFTCDVIAENGSAHIRSLCKWGPSDFTVRWRKRPSGRPDEHVETLLQSDPTWELEYAHFKALCRQSGSNIGNDIWIARQLDTLTAEALRPGEAAA